MLFFFLGAGLSSVCGGISEMSGTASGFSVGIAASASASAGAKWTLNKTDMVTLDVDWNRHAYNYYFTANTLMEDYEKSAGTIYYPYFPYLPNQKALQSDQQRTMVNLKSVFALPADNLLSAGLEVRYDWLNAPNRVVGAKVHDTNEALYLQDEWKTALGGNASAHLTAGLRLNHNSQFGLKLTPKLSAMMRMGNPWRIRATWSQGFKTPTTKELWYRYVRQMSGTYLYLGNTDLTPQTSNYFSLGGEYTWAGLSVTATGYYNHVDNMIALVTIPNYQAPEAYIVQYDPVKTRQYQNIEEAKTYGFDLTARLTLKELTLGVGYSYLDTKAEQYNTDNDRMHTVIIDGMAHHRANAFATWNHDFKTYRLGIGLYGRMSSKRYYQINGNGKGYQLWRPRSSAVFLGIAGWGPGPLAIWAPESAATLCVGALGVASSFPEPHCAKAVVCNRRSLRAYEKGPLAQNGAEVKTAPDLFPCLLTSLALCLLKPS